MLDRGNRVVITTDYQSINKIDNQRKRSLSKSGTIERFQPDAIEVDDRLIKLQCDNVKLLNEKIPMGNLKSIFDLYLYGIKQPDYRYELYPDMITDNTLHVIFIVDVTKDPQDIPTSAFDLIGKVKRL